MNVNSLQIAVVGGGGHVGLPLSLLLAQNGHAVTIIDINLERINQLQQGDFPFIEEGGPDLLKEVLVEKRNLSFSTDHSQVAGCNVVIMTVGTPVDEHLNPDLSTVYNAINQIKPYLSDGQVIILRSTLFPGTSQKIHELLRSSGVNIGVSFCPERIAQGKAIKELQCLPQIISGSDAHSVRMARQVFLSFAKEVIELNMIEAELAKLFTNTWRYITFAVANQFYTIAMEKGVDFYKIRRAMIQNYPRAEDFPRAGFAAGPCLFKDTMQLAAYNQHNFALGHAAMLVNETLPNFLVESVKHNQPLAGLKVGILGMAYKGNNDDNRESLAYKLRKLLHYENAIVMCTDPYIDDPSFFSLEQLLSEADIIFIGCPHDQYRNIDFDLDKIIDCWDFVRPITKIQGQGE